MPHQRGVDLEEHLREKTFLFPLLLQLALQTPHALLGRVLRLLHGREQVHVPQHQIHSLLDLVLALLNVKVRALQKLPHPFLQLEHPVLGVNAHVDHQALHRRNDVLLGLLALLQKKSRLEKRADLRKNSLRRRLAFLHHLLQVLDRIDCRIQQPERFLRRIRIASPLRIQLDDAAKTPDAPHHQPAALLLGVLVGLHHPLELLEHGNDRAQKRSLLPDAEN
ncbi:hypothetical protein T484DRAFT_1980834 [Baffinella frigidus]|nr:hypothetical protein T484DRAFT_1980834 [Cryptophyta sp. CCMP2293]